MRKIKQGDQVIVIAGKDKGKTGEVSRIITDAKKKSLRVFVTGVNMVKKHMRGNPQKGEQGGIIDKEAPIDVSNVAIYNPANKKADRVGFKTLEDGRKVRYYKSNGEMIDV